MAIRLLSVDVDGTLINNKNEVTEATAAALRRAMDAGIVVALNTGRDLSESGLVLERIPGIPYLMGCTGAYLMDLRSGERLTSHAMEAGLAREVYEILRRYDVLTNVFMDDLVYNRCKDLRDFARFYPQVYADIFARHVGVDDLGALLAARERPVDKFYTMFADEDERTEAHEALKKLPVFLTCAAFSDLETVAPDANKGRILLELAERLGIRPEETAAIGDSGNDVPMLRAAGVGAAMDNARPDVKAAADLVVPDNEHDGVAWVVDRILKGEI